MAPDRRRPAPLQNCLKCATKAPFACAQAAKGNYIKADGTVAKCIANCESW